MSDGQSDFDPLDVRQRYSSLSVKDLLMARDLYHYHLVHKKNVVGTGIGRYLIRKSDPWPTSNESDEVRLAGRPKEVRRFDNSEIRRYSWPCVIVLVNEWIEERAFGTGGHHPNDMVPKLLYLPDGRTVPVCVVKVEPMEHAPAQVPTWQYPKSMLGGGTPLFVETQGAVRMASIGCLVTDGHTTYALTNRHVSGRPGELVFASFDNKLVAVGRASEKQLTRLEFDKVYPDYSAKRTFLNLDIGLVEVGDVNDWTSQVYGIGEIGPLADVSEQNITLQLVGADVIAHGAASGHLQGQIKCLFYRYKTVGGYEYVADFLIAPADAGSEVHTQRGDSGTVWLLPAIKEHPLPRPLAVEWGGQVFAADNAPHGHNFALATSLSNVCKLLDVELIRSQNTGAFPYWGQMGHYSIGSFACSLVQSQTLKKLMTENVDRVSFTLAELSPKDIKAAVKKAKTEGGFIPLADVPDLVWKTTPKKMRGGRDRQAGVRTTGPEHPVHYADIDEKRKSDGKTLKDLSLADPDQFLTVKFWQEFYDDLGHTKQSARGLLPFRIWQFYDAMVDALKAGNVEAYVCAAGIVSHYVGDACQPLHGSVLADGYKDGRGEGVHSAYETNMIDRYAGQLVGGIKTAIKELSPYKTVTGGHAIALETVKLMDRSARALPPRKIVDAFVKAGGTKTVAVYDALWGKFSGQTAQIMADGAKTLALVWDSAWKAGNGDALPASKIKAISKATLQALYEEPDFVPSLDLDQIEAVLQ